MKLSAKAVCTGLPGSTSRDRTPVRFGPSNIAVLVLFAPFHDGVVGYERGTEEGIVGTILDHCPGFAHFGASERRERSRAGEKWAGFGGPRGWR